MEEFVSGLSKINRLLAVFHQTCGIKLQYTISETNDKMLYLLPDFHEQ